MFQSLFTSSAHPHIQIWSLPVCHILTTSGRFLISQPTMSPGQLMQYGPDQTRPWLWAKGTSKLAIFFYSFIPLDGSETRWGLKSLYYVNPLASQIVTFNIKAVESPSIQKDSKKIPKPWAGRSGYGECMDGTCVAPFLPPISSVS